MIYKPSMLRPLSDSWQVNFDKTTGACYFTVKERIMEREGWSENITNNNATHYYKDGWSLCKRVKDNPVVLRVFDKRTGDARSMDCVRCVNKQKEL